MKNLLVLDGNSIINRAFYGVKGNLTTTDGMPTNAIFGFVNITKKYIDMLNPDYMICTFDTHAPTFRHQKYDKYKSNRHGMPDELAVQLPYAKKAAKALGFYVLECEGYEADDIIGTVVTTADNSGNIKSYILTGDRDSLQLVSDNTNVFLMRNHEDELFNRNHFYDVYGISPEQFVDVKALMGDSSDCIPGVKGVGEKTALKLIATAGDLDKLYEDECNGFFGSGKSLIEKLTNDKENAYMSRFLAQIFRYVPCVGDIEQYQNTSTDMRELYNLFTELEFSALIKKFGIECDDKAGNACPDVTLPEIEELDNDNIEACNFGDNYAVVYKNNDLAIADVDKIYFVKDANENTLRYVFGKPIITHDYKELCLNLTQSGIKPICKLDTKLSMYLLNPGRNSYSVENLSHYTGYDSTEDITSQAFQIISAYKKLENEIINNGMQDLLLNIEIPLSTVLADMEYYGFKVNSDGIRRFSKVLKETEDRLISSIYDLAGHDFNVNSPKQLGVVLFEELELPCYKKTKSGYSTDADTLDRIKFSHPIVSEVLEYRQISKLRGTYGDALADMADENDKIHTVFNQCGTATGRLSSSEPNLQNIPIKGELGRELRRYFVADTDNRVLVDADYSQIELRLLAHLSGDKNMIESFNSGVDIHTTTASHVFKVPTDMVTPTMRSRAKAVNFGIVYGIGAYSLSQDIGCSKKEAEEYIKEYFGAYPDVERYLKDTVSDAEANGYTTTLFGRKRSIPELKNSNKNIAAFGKRVAMNSPIQGTAADIIKLAMINVSNAIKSSGIDAKLIMQVHDELILESSSDCVNEAKNILVREMENVIKLSVPLTAECSCGNNWLEAK